MKTELKPYDKYKNVELLWLDTIPNHWHIKRAKTMFNIIDVRSETGEEELLSVSSNNGVVKRASANVTMFKAESYKGYKLCWPEDLVVNSLWAWQRGLGFSDYFGIISTAYSVYRLTNKDKVNYKYYDCLVRGVNYAWELRVRSKGIWKSRYQLSDQSFMDSPMICPPKDEQDQIVRYLDSSLSKINKFIKTKKKLIEVLKEQKQAVINKAVTKGLDPNVIMKPSGISLLGDVPEQWKVVFLNRYLTGIEQGWSPVAVQGKLGKDQWGVLTLSSVKQGDFYPNENKPLSLSISIKANLEIHLGDFLITRSNTRSLVGDVCVVKHTRSKLIFSDLIYRLKFDHKHLNSEFLMYQLMSPYGRAQIEVYARGSSSTMVKISHNHIKGLLILVPPLPEQEDIAAYLNEKCAKITAVIDNVQHHIDLITEYRTRLISDVVTGKGDVRGIIVDDAQEDFEEYLDEELLDVEPLSDEDGDESAN